MAAVPAAKAGRVARRRQQNLEALIAAGQQVMAEKGIDAATMQEIADRADVGAGTVYSYFKSKEGLAIAVLERLMHSLALKIEKVTNTFDDPAQVYAFGIRTVIDTATGDVRWRQLLNRSKSSPTRCSGRWAHSRSAIWKTLPRQDVSRWITRPSPGRWRVTPSSASPWQSPTLICRRP